MAIRRFGREVADTMISAVVAGIFAGDTRKLSLRACFPKVGKIDRENRSLFMGGFQAMKRAKAARCGKPRRWKGLISVDGGLGALTGAIGERLGPGCLVKHKAETINQVDGGYEVGVVADGGESSTIACRRLLLAASPIGAAKLLDPLIPEAAAIINTIECSSLVVLNLGFKTADVGHPMRGYGFLVPHDETDFPLMGALWADSVFPQHAPSGHRLVRIFIGGSRNPSAVDRSDEELLETAIKGIGGLLRITGKPTLVDINRYPKAIPQYHVGHVEKIDRLQDIMAKHPDLHLVGNYLRGVSVNDAIGFGARMAREIMAG